MKDCDLAAMKERSQALAVNAPLWRLFQGGVHKSDSPQSMTLLEQAANAACDNLALIAEIELYRAQTHCSGRAIRALREWAENCSPPVTDQFDAIIGQAYDD